MLLRRVEAIARLRFGAVRFHHGLICSGLVIFCRRCRALGRLGSLARCGPGALGGLLGPSSGVSRLPGGCFCPYSGLLGGRGGRNCSSGD